MRKMHYQINCSEVKTFRSIKEETGVACFSNSASSDLFTLIIRILVGITEEYAGTGYMGYTGQSIVVNTLQL
jgi:hypothetical protein